MRPEKADWRSRRADLRLERADFRPDKAYLRSGIADLRLERAYFRPEKADWRSRKADLRLERADFRPEKADWRSKRPDLSLGGGTEDGETEKQNCPMWNHRSSTPPGLLPYYPNTTINSRKSVRWSAVPIAPM